MKNSNWREIYNDFEEDGIVFIDAYTTDDENESGKVIAKVNMVTKEIEYLDERAKDDILAQEVINDVLN